jgi:hypothetical protein
LLTRDDFRNAVFQRDGYQCVICKQAAADAHHIIERRLFPDGGYYLDNGASLCGPHHLEAEQTVLSCERIREAIGVKVPVLPPHLYADQPYDKWGNPILPNGTRLRGDLFFDESVQKVLAQGNQLGLFTNRVKYPRTYHLPWSPGLTKDDRSMSVEDPFAGRNVVVTIKQDGENTTLYNDFMHVRSINYEPHVSRNWVKAVHGRMAHDIPKDWRVCGENLYAVHSIHYKNLADWFQVFGIWNERNQCLSWDDTKEYAALLGLNTVPVIYEGPGDRKYIDSLYRAEYNGDPCEGYVVRVRESFDYSQFRTSVGKYVRKDHVQTHRHWMRYQMVMNGVASANGVDPKPDAATASGVDKATTQADASGESTAPTTPNTP